MRFTETRLRRAGIVILICLASMMAGANRHTDAQINSTAQFREDLRFFAREIPKRHKNAFH